MAMKSRIEKRRLSEYNGHQIEDVRNAYAGRHMKERSCEDTESAYKVEGV